MAFVEMETVEEATAAIEGLNQQLIDGRTVKANYAVPLRDELKTNKTGPAKKEKDLNFKDIQLAKKARNDAKRKKRPF
jgi:RNA recognition motif-containing protein